MNTLPSGWERKRLEELALIERGKFSVRPRNDPKYFGGEMPFVQTGDISNAKIYLTQYSQTLNESGIRVSKVFPPNSIFITIAANIGDTAITTFETACPDSIVAIQPYQEKVNTYWLNQVLRTKKNDLDAQATQNAQKNINLQVLKPLIINTPPFSEQTKIANILSMWDKAIQTTEQLLANSQQQKKALMQQLLTGKKRLKGFSGEWVKCQLKDLLTFNKGEQLNKNTLSEIGLYPVINGGILPSGYTNEFNSDADKITISEGGNSCGYVAYQTTKFWCGGHCYVITDTKLDNKFTYHLLKYNESKLMKLRVGSGLPNIQKSSLEKFILFYPSTIQEQQKIAQIISTQDHEIDTLQQKLACLKQEKKALMQKLLSGTVRV